MLRWLIILLLIVGCEEPSQHGCLDSQACNYDSKATIDNNSCIYEVDCAGVCGGDKLLDNCEVCDADTTNDCVQDECGVWGGSSIIGECGCIVCPIVTITDVLIDESTITINWEGNETAFQFSYRIEPLNYTTLISIYLNWSEWSPNTSATLESLDEGEYNFYVKSRFNIDTVSDSVGINFTIDAP